MEKADLEDLKRRLTELDFDRTPKLTESILDKGTDPLKVIDTLRKGLDEIGKKYEKGEYFLSELIVAGDLMKQIISLVESRLKGKEVKALAKIVVGTVQGDLHDIGKNVFAMLAKAAGFDVIDLGVDVPAAKYIEAVRSHSSTIVGMSALLTVTMPYMSEVLEALRRESLRENVKVIIGGAPITERFGREIGADYAAGTAVEGVEICKKWVK